LTSGHRISAEYLQAVYPKASVSCVAIAINNLKKKKNQLAARSSAEELPEKLLADITQL
jgi:hypothetical protein